MGAGGTDRGAAVETGRAGSWEWGTERPWGGTEELWHDDVGGQGACDPMGAGVLVRESLRNRREKGRKPVYTQRAYSRGAHLAWCCSFLEVFLLLYFSFHLYNE